MNEDKTGEDFRIVVVGPGALGSLLAAHLTESGRDVLLLDHRPERAEFINQRGLLIESAKGERRVRVKMGADAWAASKADLVVFCVKAYQTAEAADSLTDVLPPGARVLTLQNGLGNVEILVDRFGRERVWGGITAQGATWLGLGHIRHAGAGDTAFAAVNESEDQALTARAADLFTRAGIQTRVEQSVESLIWSKLIVNVGINPLTAVTRLRNGRLLEHAGTAEIMERAVAEAGAVSRALGIKLLYPDPLERVRQVARTTAENVASMLQDVIAMRRTEIEAINGAVAARGRELGIPTPVNDTLTQLVRTIEESYGYTV